MKLSIVLPAYNESGSIKRTLEELETYMSNYIGSNGWEIIVVNDGSSDNTLEILNVIKQNKSWLKVVDNVLHCGRGKALRTGLESSSGDIIVSLDADLSYAPYHIERLIDAMEKQNADIVLASAYCKGGTVKNVPLVRLWISKLGNKILLYMFGGGLTVLTCIVRAYKKEFIERLDLHSNDKEIHLEILQKARLLGGKIVDVPADLHWREEKLLKIGSRKNQRRSTIKIKQFSQSHLFFALLNKPSLIFWLPGYSLLLISMFIFGLILKVIVHDVFNGSTAYFAVRESMLGAAPSWITMIASFILGIQFFTLGFLTNQNKRNYEEMYRTLNAVYTKLKERK